MGVLVKEGLGEFVELFGAGRASYGVLVWFEGLGNAWGDLFCDGGGNDSAEYGAACDGANTAVGLEEWYDSCGS